MRVRAAPTRLTVWRTGTGGREGDAVGSARCPCRARERGRVAGASAVLGPTLLLPSNSLINEFDFFSNTIEVVTVFLLTTCNILMVIPSFSVT